MRCIVKDCKNHEHEGKFVGSLCFPCHEYITKAEGRHSQAYRNTQRTWERPWVSLTDDEIIDVLHPLVMADMSDEATDYEIARAIEAKLKEKNKLMYKSILSNIRQ